MNDTAQVLILISGQSVSQLVSACACEAKTLPLPAVGRTSATACADKRSTQKTQNTHARIQACHTHQQWVGVLDAHGLGQASCLCNVAELADTVAGLVGDTKVADLGW